MTWRPSDGDAEAILTPDLKVHLRARAQVVGRPDLGSGKRWDQWVNRIWRKSKSPRAYVSTAHKQSVQTSTIREKRCMYRRSFTGLLRASALFWVHSKEQAHKDILWQGYHLTTKSRVMRTV